MAATSEGSNILSWAGVAVVVYSTATANPAFGLLSPALKEGNELEEAVGVYTQDEAPSLSHARADENGLGGMR